MGGKSLVLLGLLAGGLYTYFWINAHKDQLYTKLYPLSKAPVAEEKIVNNNLEEVNVASEDSIDLDAEKVVMALENAVVDNGTQEELQSNEQLIQKLEESTQQQGDIEKDSASFYFLNECK